MENKYFQIEEVAKITGLTKRAIRYYEDIELIHPMRTETMYRLYSKEDIEKITQIRALREKLGFTLVEIKDVFDMEVSIHSIFIGENVTRDVMEQSIQELETQIGILEEKEIALHEARKRYQDALLRLKEKIMEAKE